MTRTLACCFASGSIFNIQSLIRYSFESIFLFVLLLIVMLIELVAHSLEDLLSGVLYFCDYFLISLKTKKQPTVSQSSIKVEYRSMTVTYNE